MLDRSDRGTPGRPRRRRRPYLAWLLGPLALALVLAACAGGGEGDGVASLGGSAQPTATTNGGGSSDPTQAALQFAKCMRQHGIDMPDPKVDSEGRMSITINGGRGKLGPDDPKFKEAQQACQKYLPNGGKPAKPSAEQLQKALQFARCMRQHGIDVPDPGADGGIQIRGSGPDDPKFKAAQQACQQFEPGGKRTTTGGSGSTSSGGDR